jgi:hypothetical protein
MNREGVFYSSYVRSGDMNEQIPTRKFKNLSDAVLFVIKYGPQDRAHQDDGERRAAFRADIADGLIGLPKLSAEHLNVYSDNRGQLKDAIRDCVLELRNFGDVDWSATDVVTLTSKGHERAEDVLKNTEIVDMGVLERIQRIEPRRCPPMEEVVVEPLSPAARLHELIKELQARAPLPMEDRAPRGFPQPPDKREHPAGAGHPKRPSFGEPLPSRPNPFDQVTRPPTPRFRGPS